MDIVIPYFHKALDVVVEVLSPYVDKKQLDISCVWLRQNDRTVILSTLGALTLATLYFSLSGGKSGDKKGKGDKSRERKSYKVKVKKEKVIPVDPVVQAYKTITDVKNQLQETFIPQVDKLEQDVEAERNSSSPIDPTNSGEKKSNYKDSTQYRFLYLNESLLKLLMRLDAIEPNGVEDIRKQRKATINEVQVQCRRLDALGSYVSKR